VLRIAVIPVCQVLLRTSSGHTQWLVRLLADQLETMRLSRSDTLMVCADINVVTAC